MWVHPAILRGEKTTKRWDALGKMLKGKLSPAALRKRCERSLLHLASDQEYEDALRELAEMDGEPINGERSR